MDETILCSEVTGGRFCWGEEGRDKVKNKEWSSKTTEKKLLGREKERFQLWKMYFPNARWSTLCVAGFPMMVKCSALLGLDVSKWVRRLEVEITSLETLVTSSPMMASVYRAPSKQTDWSALLYHQLLKPDATIHRSPARQTRSTWLSQSYQGGLLRYRYSGSTFWR